VNSKLLSVDVDNDLLVFDDDSFAGAKVGDVIVIADAAVVASVGGGGLATMWDAFQADGAGLVDGDEALSNPWMV